MGDDADYMMELQAEEAAHERSILQGGGQPRLQARRPLRRAAARLRALQEAWRA